MVESVVVSTDILLVAEFGEFGDDEYAKVTFKDGQTGRVVRTRRVSRAELRELRLADDLASGHERAFAGVRGFERGAELTRWLFGENDSQRLLVRALAGPLGSALEPNVLSLSRRIEIRTVDPIVLAQPWHLLSWHGLRLIEEGWSVYLTPPHVEPAEGVVPAIPLILVIAPGLSADVVDDVGTGRHVAALTACLRGVGLPGNCIRTVTSLAEIDAACERAARWDVVYYFGHGNADSDGASLLLADGFGGSEAVPLVDLEAVLRAANPSIVYINACRAGASGWFGAGHRLCAPGRVVLSHLCPIEAAAAAERALGFFRRLLFERVDPITSFSQGARGSAPSGTAWMAGTIHAGARAWRIEATRPVIRQEDGERWALGLDRSAQRATVTSGVHTDLFGKTLRGLAFVAHGGLDDLVDRFGQQAYEFLRDDVILQTLRLPIVQVDVPAPPQPTHTEEPWTEHLLAALGGQASDVLEDAVSAYLRGARKIQDGRALLWLNFGRLHYVGDGLFSLVHRWLEVCKMWTGRLSRIEALRTTFVVGLEISEAERPMVKAELEGRDLRKRFNNRGPFEYKNLDDLAPLRSDQDLVDFLGRSESVNLSEQAVERVAETIYRVSLLPGQKTLASYRLCFDHLNRGHAEGWDPLLDKLGRADADTR